MRNLVKHIYCGRKEKWISCILYLNTRGIMGKPETALLISLISYGVYNLERVKPKSLNKSLKYTTIFFCNYFLEFIGSMLTVVLSFGSIFLQLQKCDLNTYMVPMKKYIFFLFH